MAQAAISLYLFISFSATQCRKSGRYGLIGLIIYNKQENRFSLEGEKLPHLFTITYNL